MASTALGKRSCSVVTYDIESPSKRPRRSCTTGVDYNDENEDPQTAAVVLSTEAIIKTEIDDSPIKRKFSQPSAKNPVTPSTPRHYDALAGYPGSPRHTVMSAGKLFKRLTPHSPLSPSTIQTVFHSARQLFARGAEPGQLIGRETERQQLTDFLDRCISDSPNGCLYVSGPPGTGKSVMITELMQKYTEEERVKSAYINCMSVKSSKDLFLTLLDGMGLQAEGVTETAAVAALQEAFYSTDSDTTYLIALDEIDHILTMGLESLYRVFEWSLHKSSKLVLVGIANALNLTDRFLPRLKSKNLKPELLSFLPYTALQVKNIITSRLKSLMPEGKDGYVPFIHPAAIELCSRKVSSQTGDLRKAFEICRRALDLIEAETRSKHEEEARETLLQMTPSKRPLGENINGARTGGGRSIVQIMGGTLRALTAETAPRASIAHLNKVTAAAFSNGTAQRLKTLNLQQKAALCALVAYENDLRCKVKHGLPATPSKTQSLAPTVKKLFEAYCRLCTRDSVLHPLSSSEFREVMGSLETLGLVNVVDGKNGSFLTPQTPSKRRARKGVVASGDDRRVGSCVTGKDMESVADGIGSGILTSILHGEALD